jgi:hypothetical protein
MKRLISIIALVILTMSLTGCGGFEYHRHRGHGPRAVVITRPVPRPYPRHQWPPRRAPRPAPRRGHSRH